MSLRRPQHHPQKSRRRRLRRRLRRHPVKLVVAQNGLSYPPERKHQKPVMKSERRKRVVLQRNLREEEGLPKPATQVIACPRPPAAVAIVTIPEMVPLRVFCTTAMRND